MAYTNATECVLLIVCALLSFYVGEKQNGTVKSNGMFLKVRSWEENITLEIFMCLSRVLFLSTCCYLVC